MNIGGMKKVLIFFERSGKVQDTGKFDEYESYGKVKGTGKIKIPER